MLTCTDTTQKAKAVHDNMLSFWKTLSNDKEVDYRKTDQSTLTVTSISDALFNVVLEARFSEGATQQINEIDAMYKSNNISYCWWVPSSAPDDVNKSLYHEGLKLFGKVTGMVHELDKATPVGANDDRISVVTSEQDYADWIKPLQASFHMSKEGTEGYKNIFYGLRETQKFHHLMMKEDHQPISSCSIFFDQPKGLAGIYNCATVEAKRAQGVMSLLILKAIQTAHEKGFEKIVLQASSDSYSMFKKLGFVEASSYDVFLGNMP